METGHPSTRVINSGSGNRVLDMAKHYSLLTVKRILVPVTPSSFPFALTPWVPESQQLTWSTAKCNLQCNYLCYSHETVSTAVTLYATRLTFFTLLLHTPGARFTKHLKPDFHPNATHATHVTQSIALRALHKRKPQAKRKRLIGCFDDWLFRSTIPIGWRLRALRLNGKRFYAIFLLA